MRRLSSWLREAAGHHDGVEVRDLGEMRGVVATRRIEPGSEVARVPRGLLITREDARARLAARQVQLADLALSSPQTPHAVWLLFETRAPRSDLRPYLDALPRSLPRFPLHAAPADRALLDGSLTGAMLDRLGADLAADHAKLAAGVPGFTFGLDELIWARLCVASRSFRITLDGVDTTALVPFVDMLNHARRPNTRWDYDAAGGAFRLIAQRAYQPGDEVCCSYGDKPNMYLLLHYGFCVEDNEFDEAVLGAAEQIRVTRDPEEPLTQLMLSQLRARHDDEAGARAVLADAARAGLARFSTTLAEDRALLAGGGLSPDARNFIVTRLGEKRVLHAWLELARDAPAARLGW